jgi:SNF2 family DNA or RNA helicase
MIDYKLMKHQQDVVHQSFHEPDLFLAWEMGTGKSCATINILRQRFAENGRAMRTLILAPAVVLKNWKNEFQLYSKMDKNMIFVLDGPVKKRIAQIDSMKGFSAIFITNYDVMQDQKLVQSFLNWGVEILICDEAHGLKNYKSKRAKNVAIVADTVKHRYLLTGTPILNNAMDLYMQYRVLDGYRGRDSTFGNNFFAFRSKYFIDKNVAWSTKPNHFPEWVPRDSAYQELMQKIAKKTSRITKKECLDLPDLIVQNIEVGVSPEQKRLYEQMRDEYIAWVNSESNKDKPQAVVARLAITKALRLQQIISGFVKTDVGETIRIKQNPRLDALGDLLETLCSGSKVIVWACFKENYAMIAEVCKKLSIDYRELHGEQNTKEKQKSVEDFNNVDGVRVLIGNQGAGGIGVNLVPATYSIYYSRGFKLGDDLQSEARNHRRGSEVHDKITRINLVSPNSIDQLIADALQKKQNISDKILDFTKQL